MPEIVPLPVISVNLAKAASRSALIAEAQRIQHLPEHWQREQAARIVRRKLNEFKNR